MNNPQLDQTAADGVAMERVASEISELARAHARETERRRRLDDELL